MVFILVRMSCKLPVGATVVRHLYVVGGEDRLDRFGEGGMVGNKGRQRRFLCCRVVC